MGVAIPQVITEDKAGGALVIDGSLKFNYGKNNHLKRTFSAGNQTTWTWSAWIKLSGVLDEHILSVGSTSADRTGFEIPVSGGIPRFSFYNIASSSVNMLLTTSAIPRDYSGFYHIVIVADTTSATSSERLRMYINGVRVTNFSSATYPNQNTTTFLNSAVIGSIGNRAYNLTDNPFDGQITNTYLIDGQALDPSYFGYTDPLTNTWRPKKFKPQATPNNGTVWSNDLTSNVGFYAGEGAIYAFDGDNTTYASVATGGASNYLNFSCNIPIASTLRVKVSTSTNYVYINGSGTPAVSGTGYLTVPTPPANLTQLRVYGDTGVGARIYAIEVDGIELLDSDTTNMGKNAFYLPLDGNTPIGQDQSGRGNNWTPVNFGGSNTLEKATGALPILNTDGGGKVARVGVRTDSNASSLVLALPLVGIKSDFSNTINSGTSNKAITANGNAAASSVQSNFYGGSFAFDGSGDYLETSTSNDFVVGTGDFTLEAWYNVDASQTTNARLFAQNINNSSNWDCYIDGGTGTNTIYMHGGNTNLGMSFPSAGNWHHFCIVRSSGVLYSFMNGVLRNTQAYTNSVGVNNLGFRIGEIGPNGGSGYTLKGYVQDFRIYKGLAKYTQNFIPASTDPDILPDTPSGVSYSSNVALVPSTDGAVAFDGNGDYLSVSASADFGFSTPSGNANDFTIEWFQYWYDLTYYQTIWSNNYTSTPGILVQTGDGDGRYRVFVSDGSPLFQETNAPAVGSWYHYALVRNGTTYTIYRNGVANGSATSSNAAGNGTQVADIGQGNGSYYLKAFVSNFHVVKGTTLYTSNFTPPTAPLTATENTKLLCCKSQSSATAFDVSPGTITANGNAAATNFNPFTANINAVRGQESGYCTLNPLSSASNFTISNGNLKSVDTSSTAQSRQYANISISSGKYYFETTIETASNTTMTGVAVNTGLTNSYPGSLSTDWTYHSSGLLYNNGSTTSTTAATSAGDVVGTAIDMDNGKVWFSVNGNFVGGGVPSTGTNASFSSITGSVTPVFRPYASTISANFGQKPFKFPPPAGFQPLALANTPRPSIVRPDQYVGVTTYTGNGGTQSINVGFKPDFVWVKNRGASGNNFLADSVRGITKALLSDVTDSEYTNANYITSFNSNGFAVGSDSGYNANANTYVSWTWKAGGNSNTYNINDVGYATASAAGLTAGTITPTGASVNTKSGFSIITYTGPNDTNAHSFSHGLGKKPSFIIIKNRDRGFNWDIYHSSLGYNSSLIFTTAATRSGAYSAEPDSTLVNVQWNYTTYQNEKYVAYCWAEIPGFSKFGSYTGNGSSDGPMVVTGFRPRWILIKQSSASGENWRLFDTVRDLYNPTQNRLIPNLSAVEAVGVPNELDTLSNGFKLRSTDNASNGSGATYIYAAFAETPSFNLYGGQANAR